MIMLLAVLNLAPSYGSNDVDDEDVIVPPFNEFSTRLSNSLLIAGQKCQGGETVDNVNTCFPEGGPAEIGVVPIIADILKTLVILPPESRQGISCANIG